MPQPAEVQAIGNELVDAYQTVADIIRRAQQAMFDDPARRRALTFQLRREVNAALAGVDAQTRTWLLERFPTVYVLGATAGTEALGLELDPFALVHQAALQRFSEGLANDLLGATKFVRQDTKRFIRESAELVTEAKLREGETAVHAGDRLERLLDERGIKGITYKDGSRHAVDEYAQMAIRTQTAIAYNEGTLNAASSAGVVFYEVFDGFGCGWDGHDDPETANGLIVTDDEARAFPISHPNCRRSFGPRPDLTSRDGAPSTTAAQRADQASSERARSNRPPRRPRSDSSTHATRTPRSSRTARSAPAVPEQGVRASSALSSRPNATRSDVGRGVDRGLAAIEQVHRVPEGLRPVAVEATNAQGYFGQYSFGGGAPQKIRVARHGDHMASTFAHEFGHYLDHEALGPTAGAWGTRNLTPGTPMYEWAKAVDSTPTLQALRALPNPDRVSRYYMSAKEIWARSYAQYIATRSGDETMLEEVAHIRTDAHAGRKLSQWTPEEFEPVAIAIDRLFASLGLLT